MNVAIANIAVDLFLQGGPIMWPILLAMILAAAVILHRVVWWGALRSRIDPVGLDEALASLGAGDVAAALARTGESPDPFLRTLHDGLTHIHTSLLGAMQLAASKELEEGEQLQWVLGTLITLAPLLGLLGTITGIMKSFSFVGEEQLAATQVSGGIAEALIATACGLSVAIVCLIPFNYFNRQLAHYRSRLEQMINHVELLIGSYRHRQREADVQVAAADSRARSQEETSCL